MSNYSEPYQRHLSTLETRVSLVLANSNPQVVRDELRYLYGRYVRQDAENPWDRLPGSFAR